MAEASIRHPEEEEEEEIFRKEGVHHLIPKIKDILEISNLKVLKHSTRDDFDEVVNNVKSRIEKRALLKAFETIISLNPEVGLEKDTSLVIKEAGLDDKFWVPRIQEQLNLEDIRLLKSVDRAQFDWFLKHIENPAHQLALRNIFKDLTGIDMTEEEITSGPPSIVAEVKQKSLEERRMAEEMRNAQRANRLASAMEKRETEHSKGGMKDAEIIKHAQDGLLCRGIYFTEDIERTIQERDLVIDVEEAIELKAPETYDEMFSHIFRSEKMTKVFERNLDKHMSERSRILKENIWGISLKEDDDIQEESYVSCVHYHMIPAKCANLIADDVHLRPEVIRALQDVEESLKLSNYEPRGHFVEFFNKYGSHINFGLIELGGILVSTAYCKGFQENDRSKVTAVVTEASEKALLLCFSQSVKTNVPVNAYEVLSKTSGMCSEDLQNITVTVNKIGGPQNTTDKNNWERKLLENSNLWTVIKRNSPPKPLWNFLSMNEDKFENVDKLAEAMLQDWRRRKSNTKHPPAEAKKMAEAKEIAAGACQVVKEKTLSGKSIKIEERTQVKKQDIMIEEEVHEPVNVRQRVAEIEKKEEERKGKPPEHFAEKEGKSLFRENKETNQDKTGPKNQASTFDENKVCHNGVEAKAMSGPKVIKEDKGEASNSTTNIKEQQKTKDGTRNGIKIESKDTEQVEGPVDISIAKEKTIPNKNKKEDCPTIAKTKGEEEEAPKAMNGNYETAETMERIEDEPGMVIFHGSSDPGEERIFEKKRKPLEASLDGDNEMQKVPVGGADSAKVNDINMKQQGKGNIAVEKNLRNVHKTVDRGDKKGEKEKAEVVETKKTTIPFDRKSKLEEVSKRDNSKNNKTAKRNETVETTETVENARKEKKNRAKINKPIQESSKGDIAIEAINQTEADGGKKKRKTEFKEDTEETRKESKLCKVVEEKAKIEEKLITTVEAPEPQEVTINETRRKNLMRQSEEIRQDIQLWIKHLTDIDDGNINVYILELRSLRDKYQKFLDEWINDVIHLKEVQKCITYASYYIKKVSDQSHREELIAALKYILFPVDKIAITHFPNIKEILENINVRKQNGLDYFELKDFRLLPTVLSASLENINGGNVSTYEMEVNLRSIQCSLESTMNLQSDKTKRSYEYLICLGVLQLFGFTLNGFHFDFHLSAADLNSIWIRLEQFFREFEKTHSEPEKEAYALHLALNCIKDRKTSIQFMIDNMPESICADLVAGCQKAYGAEDAASYEKLQRDIDKILRIHQLNTGLHKLIYSLKYQLQFVKIQEKTQRKHQKEAGIKLIKPVEKLLDILDMKQYYPQKLTLEDLIMLTSDVLNDTNKKPTTLKELPWYFMKHIIGLNSDTRENCHVTADSFDTSDDDSSDDDEEGNVNAVHPLDLIYIIFLCADDFLRQELTDKMARCQYAVPFILPSAQDVSADLILHWGLKSMTRNFYDNGRALSKTMVDVEAPLISCMSIGEETSWKSKLLNKMLSPQQEVFWHQGLEAGNCKQRISQGMVEVAWYLPGRHESNTFSRPMTFANLRKNVPDYDIINNTLYDLSSVTCLFTEEVNEQLKAVLNKRKTSENTIIVVLHTKEKIKKIKQECTKLQEEYKLDKHQIICKTADDANFNIVYKQLKKSVEHMINSNCRLLSLSMFIMKVKAKGNMNVDDQQCYFGQMAAESILGDIDKLNNIKQGSAKAIILPCQTDLESRQEIAALEKELCRQRKLKENITMQKYASHIKEKKWQLQLLQLRKPVSEAFKYFLQCLLNLDVRERKYFVQCLKLGLNERSTEQLQPLYEEYQKCHLEKDSKERDKKLAAIDKKMTCGSLGIEHFFREMAVLYENLIDIKKITKLADLDDILGWMPVVAAEILMDGIAIEIMDGDAVNVPVTWLSAVFEKIENNKTARVFKVSALGAQSCGKSTLLNTTFGLNFPVSSGRCTRGAYMQLVKVDDSFKKTLNCDFVALIDSEGLMSRRKTEGSYFDNELSTFIIGLSDLTLVIIKGEGAEMQDVLPLAGHVFLRMNLLGERQACHFVHQNMGAVDAVTKITTEIEAFVRDLNSKTLAAAIDTDKDDCYKKFTDVLQYDSRTDNTYAPGLWDGALPMGKTNVHYSETMEKLKSNVIQQILKMRASTRKTLSTFDDFRKRLAEIWKAIKYENFVLSFKNVLAVEAHRKLTKVFDEVQWANKREIREMIQKEEHIIENDIKGGHSNRTVKELIDKSTNRVTESIAMKITGMQANIVHYFQCIGCTKCDEEVKNRHLLANNEQEFRDDIRSIKKTLTNELESSMESLENKLKADKHIHELSKKMDETLKRKVQEAIGKKNSENLTTEAIEGIFNNLWEEASGDILKKVKYNEQKVNIKAHVEMAIKDVLRSHEHLYFQKQDGDGSGYPTAFVVEKKKHMKRKWGEAASLTDQDVYRLQQFSEETIEETKRHYDSNLTSGGRLFKKKDVETLLNDVLRRIHDFDDQRFKTKSEYMVDLVDHIGKSAAVGYNEINDKYLKESSSEALLEKKKKSYHDLFMIKMGQINASGKFCENFLKDMILENIEDQLSGTELLHDLREKRGRIFRDMTSLQAIIVKDLLKQNNFEGYLAYIEKYEKVVKDRMSEESLRHFTTAHGLKDLALRKLEQNIHTILFAMDRTVNSSSENKDFIKAFFGNIENLKISHNEAAAYLGLEVPDKQAFGEVTHRLLEGSVRDDIIRTINSWDIKQKLKEKGLIDFLFTELVGCKAKCPFCRVPCDAHSGGKTQGNHSATLHRPKGLSGYHNSKTRRLVVGDCRTDIISNRKFRNDKTNNEHVYFKDYQTLYPDWTIQGEADPDVEKYWKWVFAQHNAAFAKYYSDEEADIPKEWMRYEIDDILKEIEANYHIIKADLPADLFGSNIDIQTPSMLESNHQ